ncbi:MAG: hypothetical protein ACKOAM_08045 [Chakrabartia sp.]
MSEAKREAVNAWYSRTLLSRLNNKAQDAIILVQQRLHLDDLAGHVERTDKTDTSPKWRINAHDIEQLTTNRVAQYLNSPAEVSKLAGQDVEAMTLQNALAQADLAATTLRSGTPGNKHKLITRLIERVTLHADRIEIVISLAKLREQLHLPQSSQRKPITLTVEATRARKGHQIRLVIPGAEQQAAKPKLPKRNDKAVLKLADAFEARRLVMENPTLSLAAIAKAHGRCHKQLAKLVKRSCVDPEKLISLIRND